MQNNKREKRNPSLRKYILISLLVLSIAIVIGAVVNVVLSFSYKSNEPTEHVIGMLDGIIGAIATGLVLFQLKSAETNEAHQNEIEEASFLLQYNQSFIQDPNMVEVEHLLEDQVYYSKEKTEIVTADNRQKFVNYLVYLEGLAPLVLNGILRLEFIDNLMAYRFFLAVDNVELQEKEILPFADYYRGCFRLYRIWKQFRKERGYLTPCEDRNDKNVMRELSEWKDFDQFSR